jgi:hypothetical protein
MSSLNILALAICQKGFEVGGGGLHLNCFHADYCLMTTFTLYTSSLWLFPPCVLLFTLFACVLIPCCYVFSAPKLKGRPRKRRKGKEPADPNSPEGSDSNGSENSMAVAGKVRLANRGG